MREAWRRWLDGTGTPLAQPPDDVAPSVTGILLGNHQSWVLLDHRADNGYWGLPGGAVQVGESVQDALVREIAEETSYTLDARLLRLTGIYSDPTRYGCSTYSDRVRQYVNLTFVYCAPLVGAPRPSAESIAIAWRPVYSLPETFMPAHAQRLRDALHVLHTSCAPLVR